MCVRGLLVIGLEPVAVTCVSPYTWQKRFGDFDSKCVSPLSPPPLQAFLTAFPDVQCRIYSAFSDGLSAMTHSVCSGAAATALVLSCRPSQSLVLPL